MAQNLTSHLDAAVKIGAQNTLVNQSAAPRILRRFGNVEQTENFQLPLIAPMSISRTTRKNLSSQMERK